jgi:hypothetical protein
MTSPEPTPVAGGFFIGLTNAAQAAGSKLSVAPSRSFRVPNQDPPPGDRPPVALRRYDGRRPDPPTRDYRLTVTAGTLVVEAGAADSPAATVTADSTTWSGVLFGGLPLAHAERAGTARVHDRAAVERTISLYSP